MTPREEFLSRIASDVFEEPDRVLLETDELVRNDSLVWLIIIILLDELFGVAGDPERIKEAKTVGDILGMLP